MDRQERKCQWLWRFADDSKRGFFSISNTQYVCVRVCLCVDFSLCLKSSAPLCNYLYQGLDEGRREKKGELKKEAVNLQRRRWCERKKDGGEERSCGLHCKKWFCFYIQGGPHTLDMSWTTWEDHSSWVQQQYGWMNTGLKAGAASCSSHRIEEVISFYYLRPNLKDFCERTHPENIVLNFMNWRIVTLHQCFLCNKWLGLASYIVNWNHSDCFCNIVTSDA